MIRKLLVLMTLVLLAAAPLQASGMDVKKSTPILLVDRIEPSLEFWTGTLGFTITMKVDEGERLGFVALALGEVEVMFQTRSSVEKDNPELAGAIGRPASFLYMEVDSIDALIPKLENVEIFMPKRETFYGSTEIGIREPGGHYITFAEFPEAAPERTKTENTLRLDQNAPRPAASIAQLSWLAGSWEGEAFDGQTEEIWTPPSAGSMTGIFKLMHGDESSLYEFMLIVEDEGSLVIRLKHYNNDFSAWEEKDGYISFPLVRLEGETAYFDGLTYKRIDNDRMTVFLAVSSEEGVREEVFHYRRTAGSPR